MTVVYNHAPIASSWTWRCILCGLSVDHHAGWFRRLVWRWTGR